MVRVLWSLFFASLLAVAYLCLTDERRADRPDYGWEQVPIPRQPAPDKDAPTGEAPSDIASQGAEKADAGKPAEGTEDETAPRTPPRPEEFIAYLKNLAKAGDIETLSEHLSPGVVRMTGKLFVMALLRRAGNEMPELDKALDALSFDFEELPDGLLRLDIAGLTGAQLPEPVYLAPVGGSWEIVAESDLPGPAADARSARNHLQLLALCQHTYFTENLLGGDPAYAGTARELVDGLDGSPVYAGFLDPQFIAAVDGGLPYDGYVFGPVTANGEGFAYYAAPATYGAGSQETYLIDGEGRVWAKDLGGEPPPAAWPGPSPGEQGWEPRGTGWR